MDPFFNQLTGIYWPFLSVLKRFGWLVVFVISIFFPINGECFFSTSGEDVQYVVNKAVNNVVINNDSWVTGFSDRTENFSQLKTELVGQSVKLSSSNSAQGSVDCYQSANDASDKAGGDGDEYLSTGQLILLYLGFPVVCSIGGAFGVWIGDNYFF
jgi:hypothetical protein